LLLLEPRDEDGVELEPLRLVQGQKVDAADVLAAGVEAAAEVGDEVGRGALERVGERDEPGEVGLADELPLAELVRQLLEPAGVASCGAHGVGGVPVAA